MNQTKKPVQEQGFTITLLGNDLVAIVHGLDLLQIHGQRLILNEALEPFRARRIEHLEGLRNRLDNLVAEAHNKREVVIDRQEINYGGRSAEEDDQRKS